MTPRGSSARRRPASPAARAVRAPLAEARQVDLASMRLVLREHLDELRARGVDETVLRPLETELSRWDDTIDELVRRLCR